MLHQTDLCIKVKRDIEIDRDWLLKYYRQTIERFHDDMYWEIINFLVIEKLQVYYCLYYSVLPFRVWSHFWSCCRSQYEPTICQCCTKLLIKNKKVDKEIRKRLTIDSRKNMPSVLYYGVISNDLLSLLVHINCGRDRQRSCSENNFGVLYYEVISSPFVLWKFYLDVSGRIVLNQCGKFVLPALFANIDENECRNSTACLFTC